MIHYKDPSVENTHLVLCYRNFQSKNPAWSHVGLGVNALHTAKVLRAHKVQTDIQPIWTAKDLQDYLLKNESITHVVVEAPFIATADFIPLLHKFTNIQFTCRCHSNVGFLQVEAGAINLIREYLRLQDQFLNFRLSVNSGRLGIFLQEAYNGTVLLIPNLYYVDHPRHRYWKPPGKLIRAGSLGSIRLQKNHITSAAAALMMAAVHNCDLEFYITINREEQGRGVLQSIKNFFTNVPYAKLVELPWSQWTDFRSQVANLDIHFQLSMSESFNIVTADCVAEGVPTVVSEAIDWCPPEWVTSIDDPNEAAEKAWQLINNPNAVTRGLEYLHQSNRQSLSKWLQWIGGNYHTMVDYHLQ